jgi:hypothetical protein
MIRTPTHLLPHIVRSGLLLAALLCIAPDSDAQRRGSEDFRGNWKGTLSPDLIFGAPEDHRERLSQPVEFELRVFNRGAIELFFTSEEDEWEFAGRDMQLTQVGDNGVILGRLSGTSEGSQSAFSFNLTRIDEDTLLVNWSKLSTRVPLRFDGLDELALAGTDELRLDD